MHPLSLRGNRREGREKKKRGGKNPSYHLGGGGLEKGGPRHHLNAKVVHLLSTEGMGAEWDSPWPSFHLSLQERKEKKGMITIQRRLLD